MLAGLLQLLFSFGKIGLISLGGGNSMLKLIEHEAVINQSWISNSDFTSMIGATFLFPGLTAVKLSALIGYQVAGILGMLVAVLALNLPGLVLSLVGYRLLMSWQSPIADKLMLVVQYGALALLAAASFSIANGVFKQHFSILLFSLTIGFFILLSLFNLSPFWGLLAFIALGYGCLSI